jgi:hypothetical protein
MNQGRHFSFKAMAEDDVLLPKYFLALGQGVNVFNVAVDSLDVFLEELKANGVRVLATYRLDDLDEIPPVTHDLALGDAGPDPFFLPTSGSSSHDR